MFINLCFHVIFHFQPISFLFQCVVPSVATQYVRNRKSHDTTAQQWTETYAKASPSIPAPPKQGVLGVLPTSLSPIISSAVTTAPAEVVQTRPSRSSRTSSWRHESAAGPSTTNANTSRSNEDARASLASSTVSEEIIVLDSDEDTPVRDSSKGKKRKRQARQKRNDTLDHDSEHDEHAKRTKTQFSSARSSTLASGSGDVIIIED